jgi:hypothetical protein
MLTRENRELFHDEPEEAEIGCMPEWPLSEDWNVKERLQASRGWGRGHGRFCRLPWLRRYLVTELVAILYLRIEF